MKTKKKHTPNRLLTDTLREIKNTRSRFVSILVLSALAVCFLAGLRVTEPDMKNSVDQYLDAQRLMDLRAVATLGLTQEDVDVLGRQEGVALAQGAYTVDATVKVSDKDSTVKVLSFTEDINIPDLLEGRLPEQAGECLVEPRFLQETGLSLGDKIVLDTGTGDYEDALVQEEFTIVGSANSPLYIGVERGSSTLGTGKAEYFLLLPMESFAMESYTDAYLLVDGAAELMTYSDEYDQLIQSMILPAVDSMKNTVLQKGMSAIPGIGSGLNSAMTMVIGSAVVIKNSIGAVGILVLIVIIVPPVIEITAVVLTYLLAGIMLDDVSNYTMLYQVQAVKKDGNYHKGMAGFAKEQHIVQVPLAVLTEWDALYCPQNEIYIVENPSVFAMLCGKEETDHKEKAYMCMNGQPRLAGLMALDLLAKSETRIYYAGDLDPEGVLIAQKLSQYYKGEFYYWHMEAADYERCRSKEVISPKRLKILERITDERLKPVAALIGKYRTAGYQEMLAEDML